MTLFLLGINLLLLKRMTLLQDRGNHMITLNKDVATS